MANDTRSNTDRAPSAGITSKRRQDRTTDELVGICRGLLADGHVSQQEAEFLKGWIERTSEFVGSYPFSHIYKVLSDILKDGFIDADESADLHDTLIRFVGGEAFDPIAETASLSTSLPLCTPPPAIAYQGRSFLVTGTFSYGTRPLVHAAIAERGGLAAGNISKNVNFLIIGDLGSRDWINSNAGRKIQAAIELRDAGHAIAIVSEQHWASSL